MSSEERPLPEPMESASPTEPLNATEPPAANAELRRGRWSGLREPAKRHPIGAALGAAGVGLVVGLLGGIAIDAHPMMSLTVGTAPYATQSPGPGAAPPPAPHEHGDGERGIGPAGPPPPPGERGPGSGPRPPAEGAPPGAPGAPEGPQDRPGPDRGRAEQPAPPAPIPTA